MKFKNLIKTIKSLKNPFEFRKFILYKLISLIYRRNHGTYILNEDWDNLIILDACRYDFFESIFNHRNMIGNLESRISRGSHTIPFLIENFKNKKYSDIIYITANPQVDIHLKDSFYKIVSVWKEGWNEKYHTVLPETMYNFTSEIIKKFPNKKIIIHFMQPHYPYIEDDFTLDSLEYLRKSALDRQKISVYNFNNRKFKENFWALYSYYVYKMFDINVHIRGYWKNLNLTVPYLEKLIQDLKGLTVVTSDHGEAFGEYIHPLIPIRYYGHRKGVRIPVLVKVPWLVINKGRKKIIKEKELSELEIIDRKIKDLRFSKTL